MISSRSQLWVVKIGGSLAHSPVLGAWLEVLSGRREPRILIVPGGGAFAEEVRKAQREWGFDDGLAHRMALAAMDQYGLMLSGLSPGLHPAESKAAMSRVHRRGGVPVWLPTRMTAGRNDIPETWDVTSDSLAAWLAGVLGARFLVLVKSVDPPPGWVSAANLHDLGLVDKAFTYFVERGAFESWCVGADRLDKMERALQTGTGPGSRILSAT